MANLKDSLHPAAFFVIRGTKMFKPMQDYVLVYPIKRWQSAVLEVVSFEKFNRGLVVAVGPGKMQKDRAIDPCQVQPGDFVCYVDMDSVPNYYRKYFEDDVEYRLMQDKDIAFVGERSEIDAGNELCDSHIAKLLSAHNIVTYDKGITA